MFSEEGKNRQKTWVKIGDKIVGCVERGVFCKYVCGSKHMLKSPKAWAIQAQAWDETRSQVRVIAIVDKETSYVYSISATDFDSRKQEIDRGFGRQYYVELEYWSARQGRTNGG